MVRLLFALVLLLPLSAGAQETARPDDVQTLRACLASTPLHAAERCHQRVFGPCVNAPGMGTTLGTTECHLREYRAWDVLLNDAYQTARRHAISSDDQAHRPEFARFGETLRDAQRAWITLRDADCAMAYARFGAGSMRHIASTACLSRMTAERTVFLQRLLEG